MYNFFVDVTDKKEDRYYITGGDYNHISNVLRMKIGDTFLVSCDGKSDLCRLELLEAETAVAQIIECDVQDTNLPIDIYLFQGLPKSDKMEFIIQKAVELGVHTIIPVEMENCVVKLDDKKKKSKQSRWQAIAESAAKQSKRNQVPTVQEVLTYKQALEKASELDIFMIPYENEKGMIATREALSKIKGGMSVGLLIGPEGGFSEKEAQSASGIGTLISLGKRILRTETAAVTAMAMCMLYTEMNLNEDNV